MKAVGWGSISPKFVLTWFTLALTIVVLCPIPYAVAQEPGESAPVGEVVADSDKVIPLPEEWYKKPTKNLFTLTVGLAYWPSLGNKEFGTTSATNLPGHVNSTGLALEAAYHRQIVHWKRGDLYLGAEIGGFAINNSYSVVTASQPLPITGDLNAAVLYAGPSIKFMMGQGRFKYFLGAGGGYYLLDLTEKNSYSSPTCYGPCVDVKRSFQKGTIGGYVSLGVDLAAFRTDSGWVWRLRLEDKIHLVNFGSLDSFAPGAGNLSGPINVIQIGVVTGF